MIKNGIENGYYHEITPAGFGIAIKAGKVLLVLNAAGMLFAAASNTFAAAADKNTSLNRWKPIQKSVNRLYEHFAVNFLLYAACIRYQFCDFIQHNRNLSAAALACGILFVPVQR